MNNNFYLQEEPNPFKEPTEPTIPEPPPNPLDPFPGNDPDSRTVESRTDSDSARTDSRISAGCRLVKSPDRKLNKSLFHILKEAFSFDNFSEFERIYFN